MGTTYIGTSKLKKMFINGIKVKKIFLGTTQIFSGGLEYNFTPDSGTGGISLTGSVDGDWVLRITKSGTLNISYDGNVDIWGIGGGGAGGRITGNWYPFVVMGGGGSGYTSSLNNTILSEGINYSIVIGSGGTEGGDGSASTIKNGNTTILSAAGGKGGGTKSWSSSDSYVGSGGAGGSGGGGAGGAYANRGGNGGSNGSNGEASSGGAGSGSNASTYEFGDSNFNLLGGGGGGGKYNYQSSNPQGQGGSGGGGSGARSLGVSGTAIIEVQPTNGIANTGGGGGGQAATSNFTSGGSGIVCIRNHR